MGQLVERRRPNPEPAAVGIEQDVTALQPDAPSHRGVLVPDRLPVAFRIADEQARPGGAGGRRHPVHVRQRARRQGQPAERRQIRLVAGGKGVQVEGGGLAVMFGVEWDLPPRPLDGLPHGRLVAAERADGGRLRPGCARDLHRGWDEETRRRYRSRPMAVSWRSGSPTAGAFVPDVPGIFIAVGTKKLATGIEIVTWPPRGGRARPRRALSSQARPGPSSRLRRRNSPRASK